MGRLERKLLSLLLLLTVVPLAVVYGLSDRLFERALEIRLNPQIREALTDSVQVFGEFVRAEKGRQRAEARRLAEGPGLAAAAAQGEAALRAYLQGALPHRVRALALLPRATSAEIAVEAPEIAVEAPEIAPSLLSVEEIPLTLAGWRALRVTYALERRFFTRFRGMEEEVIRPLAAFEADRDNVADILTWSFIAYLALVLLLAGGVAVVVGRRITRRLSALKQGMEAVAAGALETRVTPQGHDEIAALAVGFNEMAHGLGESQRRVEYLTQMSAWQGIARKLAHEIKNPLTPILLSVQQLHQSYRGEDARYQRTLNTVLEVVEQEVATLRRLVENFSRFARLPQAEPKPEDLCALARDVAAAHPEVDTLEIEAPSTPIIAQVDRSLFRQVLTNLIKNGAEACDAANAPRWVRLSVAREGRVIYLRVEDHGPGVPLARRAQIFEPYVTDKDEGTGLGLAIVKKIVLDHGGAVEALEGAAGACFEIRLPS
ncbi:HAMP domain-containing protein [Myxococcota bacterium]|nr:HAMP domain-containing protein [Myxococcota bacterium]MBU1896698.1 HAMP domain-containing protein [Myxococcota bacterium]